MNYCNFAKVIIARSTKDKNLLTWWENHEKNDADAGEISINRNCRNSNDVRYNMYHQIMHRFPKMYVPLSVFKKRLPRIQNYVTDAKYYKKNNMNGERKQFVEFFSLQNWAKLSKTAKQGHSITDCRACTYDLHSLSSLHLSYSRELKDAINNCQDMTESFLNSTGTKTMTGAINIVKAMVNTMKPIFEKKTGQNFTDAISKSLNLTPKLTSEEKRKQNKEKLQNSHEKLKTTLSQDDFDVNYFLSSGKSYSQHERDRLAAGFTSKEESAAAQKKNQNVKNKKHHGPFQSYHINQEALENELENMPSNRPINWTRLAKKINVVTKKENTIPLNGGQVLKQFAISKGINLKKFSTNGTEQLRRVRRSKKKIGYRLSIPSMRSAKVFKRIIKRNIQSKKFDIGEEVAPKFYKTNFINSDGDLQEKTEKIYGRKIPLKTIISNEVNRLEKGGVVRHSDYEKMTQEQFKHFCTKILEPELAEHHNGKDTIQQKEKEWKLKMWHDHSDILNHSYVSFMTCFLYDPINFLTDEEYAERFPEKKKIDVQSFVERPQLYIFGLSGKIKNKHE